MCIKAVLFDLNGTLIKILTDENKQSIYDELSKFLLYYSIHISPEELKAFYFEKLYKQLNNGEKHPEFNAELIFADLLKKFDKKIDFLPQVLAKLFRSLSLSQLELYPDAYSVIQMLSRKYLIAAVSDAQAAYAFNEAEYTGIKKFFSVFEVSGLGNYRKPDSRMFTQAASKLNVTTQECVFVGNDIYTDIYGAKLCNMKTIMIRSGQGVQHMDGIIPDYDTANLMDLCSFIENINN